MGRGPLDRLPGAHLTGPRFASVNDPHVGLTVMGSGQLTSVVSTTVVASGDLIFHSTIQVGSIGANSAGHIVVNSIVTGVSFAFARSNTITKPWDDVVAWEIIKTQDLT